MFLPTRPASFDVGESLEELRRTDRSWVCPRVLDCECTQRTLTPGRAVRRPLPRILIALKA